MRTATIVSVTPEGQLELPPDIQARLVPGDEYLIWQTEDTILFKKIQKPLQLDDLFRRIEAIGPGPDDLSEAEICQMVKEVRHKRASDQSNP